MDFEKLYIDGAWVPSASDKWIEVEQLEFGQFPRLPHGGSQSRKFSGQGGESRFRRFPRVARHAARGPHRADGEIPHRIPCP